ncbi:MAG: DUF21 domain-containing protein [Planctomycetales bacterium]|nr:DUF21 domain-containing protein [Planctomycetales bacterium]
MPVEVVPDTWAVLIAYMPGMLALLLLSSFFSGSEAAFFSLTLSQKRQLQHPSRACRLARALLNRSDRLLMGILFWNLAINLVYFSVASRIALTIQSAASTGESNSHGLAAAFMVVVLIVIILFGEFLPKSVAVLNPLPIAKFVAIPLSLAVRCIDVFLPILTFANEASRRILWPGLKPESYLELSDIDRAVELSTSDSKLFQQEKEVLQNVISLSDIRVEEWMRPRTQYLVFRPPLDIKQLGGQRTPSGYMLVTDPEGREIVSAVDLHSLLPHEVDDLQNRRVPLVVVPWCATVADALLKLKQSGCKVAVVVNEYGETVGILTWEEIFEAILQLEHKQSKRQLARAEIRQVGHGQWVATGITKLRRLERLLGIRLDTSNNLTVTGLVQEQLRRLPEEGDVCVVDGWRFEVIDAALRGEVLFKISSDDSEQGDREA